MVPIEQNSFGVSLGAEVDAGGKLVGLTIQRTSSVLPNRALRLLEKPALSDENLDALPIPRERLASSHLGEVVVSIRRSDLIVTFDSTVGLGYLRLWPSPATSGARLTSVPSDMSRTDFGLMYDFTADGRLAGIEMGARAMPAALMAMASPRPRGA
jgi:hypothetical protein